MKQYCRYCAFCFEADDFRCSNYPEKQLHMSRKDINRANKCKGFALSDLGDVETGKPYRPLKKARSTKSDKEKQMTIDLIIGGKD